jgi:hypothetical protein
LQLKEGNRRTSRGRGEWFKEGKMVKKLVMILAILIVLLVWLAVG